MIAGLDFPDEGRILFDGRIENGRVWLGELVLDAAEAGLAPASAGRDGACVTFVRPHDLELAPLGTAGAVAELEIRHAVARGGMVKVELAGRDPEGAELGRSFEAEMSRAAFASAGWQTGSPVAALARAVRAYAV